MDRRSLFKTLAAAPAGAAALEDKPAQAAREKPVAPTDAVGMLYDATRCVGCKACVVACRDANGLPPAADADGLHDLQTELNCTTKNVIQLHQERDAAGAVTEQSFTKRQCMHCVDPACVSACMIGALQKREFGIVTWEADTCVGCRYCQVACPFNVPKFEWDVAAPRLVKCELCLHRLKEGKQPGCTEVCPAGAVVFGKLEDLKAEAHRRLAAAPAGTYLPKVYGEHDAGGTQVLYLSHVPFEKLGLPDLGTDGVPHLSETVQHGVYQGMATPAVLYAAVGAIIWRNKRKEAQAHGQAEGRDTEGTP